MKMSSEGSTEPLLDVRALRKQFRRGGETRVVVQGVSFTVGAGEVVGLLGPNGAGKTTTFRMTMGMLRPDVGEVLLGGEDITHLPMYARARAGLGYLPQETSIFRRMTVEENLLAILETLKLSRKERKEQLEELLQELDLGRLRKSKASVLSGGEKRRLEITRALVIRPSVMLLDEPFAGVDPLNKAEIRGIVRRLSAKGLGVLITDHDADALLRTVDRAYIIAAGKILLSGTPQEIAEDERAREAYLGHDFNFNP